MLKSSADMYSWYVSFYRAAAHSRAHSAFCERVYGRDLCQHGYTTMRQLDNLLQIARLNTGDEVLDLGCGTGKIAEYVSDITGARVVGVDCVPDAIEQARMRTADRRERLTFQADDMNTADFPPAAFDAVLALDTLYYGDPDMLISRLKTILKPGGQLLVFYNFILWNQNDDRRALYPDRTPLGVALERHGLPYYTWDYTDHEYQRSLLSRRVALELEAAFEAEGNCFLFENRMVEANGNISFYESGRICRYLYQAHVL